MAVTAEQLMALPAKTHIRAYEPRDLMLYALSLGLSADPMNRTELRYTTEKGFVPMPTVATVLGFDLALLMSSGLNFLMVVHGEQRLQLLAPVPPSGIAATTTRVMGVVDKGPGKGALLVLESLTMDQKTDVLWCRQIMTVFARGDGGCGHAGENVEPLTKVPDGAPSLQHERPTLLQQALLYRLNADTNPLHSDPDFAKAAGFPRPILHGLSSYGVAAASIIEAFAGNDPKKIAQLDGRFSAPVFPGETLITELWQTDAHSAHFRVRVKERDVIAIDSGLVRLKA